MTKTRPTSPTGVGFTAACHIFPVSPYFWREYSKLPPSSQWRTTTDEPVGRCPMLNMSNPEGFNEYKSHLTAASPHDKFSPKKEKVGIVNNGASRADACLFSSIKAL